MLKTKAKIPKLMNVSLNLSFQDYEYYYEDRFIYDFN